MSRDEAMPGAAFEVQAIPEYLTLTCGYVDQRWLVNSFGMPLGILLVPQTHKLSESLRPVDKSVG
jgi:hypothetical protein